MCARLETNILTLEHDLANCYATRLLAAATSLSLANLVPAPTHTAIINVSDDCTLVDAITSANSDAITNSCSAGNGEDAIVLQNSRIHPFTVRNNSLNGANIKRNSDFRLIA